VGLRPGRAGLAALLLGLAWATAAAAGEAQPRRRGPIELRDEWLLSQMRLTLPAQSPELLAPGAMRFRLNLDWGNDFGWDQSVRGEQPSDRRFLVDGEHRTLGFELRRGLGSGIEAGARLPLRWRGPGILDGMIDAFHVVTLRLGLPDNGRSSFLKNRFRVLGRDAAGAEVVWHGEPGTGLGNLELDLRWAPGRGAAPRRWAIAGAVTLPTGTGAFEAGGLEAGLQFLGVVPLAASLDLYGGLGGTVFGDTELAGIEYERFRCAGFVVVEWRPARAASLLVELNGASRLVTNLARYPGVQSYLRIGAKLDLPHRMGLEAGFTENLVDQQATTDFGAFLGVTRRF